MLHKTQGIVIRNTRYKETSYISSIYTQKFGLLSFISNSVLNGKGIVKPAHLMHLNILNMVIYYRPNANLHRIKELKCQPILHQLHFDVIKNSVVLFVSEVLNNCITEEEENAEMYHFLEHFIQILDLEDGKVSNYPLFFLMHLSRYLGFYPKGNYKEGQLLNLQEGLFIDSNLAHESCISAAHSAWWWYLLNCNVEQIANTEIPSQIKNKLMDDMLLYYEIHALNGKKITSHIILREVFSD